jgi:hypothetical protein
MPAPITTQQRHPWRAAVRTTLEVALVLATAAIAAGPLIADFIESTWPGSPVVAWITAGVAFLASLSGLLARLAALPAVDAALQRILKLGSAPGVDGGRHAA